MQSAPKFMDTIWRFVKYCVTGALNTAVSYVVFAGLVWFHSAAAVSLAIGYACGMLTSYTLNARWTFQSKGYRWQRLIRFLVVNLIVLGLNEVMLHFLLQTTNMSPYLAQLITLIPTTLIGFFANRRFVFAHIGPRQDAARDVID